MEIRTLLIYLLGLLSFTGKGQSDTSWTNTKLLYSIEDSTGVRGYLFGTIHSQDSRVHSFDSTVFKALESCEVLALELDMEEMDYGVLLEGMMMDSSLSDIYGKVELEAIHLLIKEKVGFPPAMANKMKPIFIALMAMESNPLAFESDFEILDLRLANYAKSKSIPVKGLETPADQFNALGNLPPSFEIELLLNLTRKSYRDSMRTASISENEITESYIYGAVDSIDWSGGMLKLPPEFETELITLRNQNMAQTILDLIQDQTLFIGIGAGHLHGPQGVKTLLEEAGFSLVNQPVKFHIEARSAR